MRRIKAVPLLIAAAIAVGALAVPAVASASFHWWKVGEGPIKGSETISLNGGSFQFLVLGAGGQLKCPTSGQATLAPNGKGELTGFSFDAPKCETSGSTGVANCLVSGSSSKTPFPMELKSTESVSISNFAFTLNFTQKPGKPKCNVTQLNIKATQGTTITGVLGFNAGGFLESMKLTGLLEWSYGSIWVKSSEITATPLAVTPFLTYGTGESP